MYRRDHKPMNQRDIAKVLGLHESRVSKIVNHGEIRKSEIIAVIAWIGAEFHTGPK